ncbi:MAG: coniferyl aldehyde dehydrogenase [Pseudomonadota bacterium]
MNVLSSENATDLRATFETMRTAYTQDTNPSYVVRKGRLDRLEQAVEAYADRLVAAMQADFSHRSAAECNSYDVTLPIGEIRSAKRHLRGWMRRRRVGVPKHMLPARARLVPQPLGVVGVISPWNFPVYLAIGPLAAALAAGNRAMVKPSELTPRTSDAVAEMIAAHFAEDEVAVVNGGPIVAAAFADLPFDHLLFTGSTAIGRKVAQAAAANLTPVTLELGGKSPAIVTPSADLELAAKRIAFGKCTNAGQICTSPDYALVPRNKVDAFVEKLTTAMQTFYPDFGGGEDYSAIISDRHVERLTAMVEEAEAAGAKVVRLPMGQDPGDVRKIAPTVVIDPSTDLRLMQEEIFGPILPVIPYDTHADALAFVAERDRPLALYVFADSTYDRDLWLEKSISGGVAVNETLFHVACDTLPFGGVGASGIGAYHGDAGFETFSHMKPVFIQPKLNGAFLFDPPMTELKQRFARVLRKII